MCVLQILLFWIPVAGSLIAGFVGGRKAGGVGEAATAVFLPTIGFSVLFSVLAAAISTLPVIGVFAGAGGFEYAALHVVPLLAGAAVGGLRA